MDTSREQPQTPERVRIWKLRRSRDNWKSKCRQRREQVRDLLTRLRDVERSRDAWRDHCLALDAAPARSGTPRPLGKKTAAIIP